MNKDFEDIRRAVQHLMADVEPNDPVTVSTAIVHYIISIDEAKRFKAAHKEPRIKVPEDKSDGWRGRMQRNFNSANDEEIKR